MLDYNSQTINIGDKVVFIRNGVLLVGIVNVIMDKTLKVNVVGSNGSISPYLTVVTPYTKKSHTPNIIKIPV